jgi:hypothetical protein
MTHDTKEALFPVTFGAAAFFYAWAIVALWMGPSWNLSGNWYMLVGVLPAFLGVTCTVMALALHLELRDGDSAN